jgi:hypothetical protein
MRKDFFKPHYRNRLKAKIHEAGFKTLSEYSVAAGVDIARISRIITGWEIPSRNLAKRLSGPIGVNLDEFGKLL